MMVVVEGKQMHCWNCKQLGHLAKACPQKAPKEKQQNTTEDIISTTKEKDKDQLDPENQWIQVHRKKKTHTKTINKTTPKDTSSDTTVQSTKETAIQTNKTPKNKNTALASKTKINPKQTEEKMETTANLKKKKARRRRLCQETLSQLHPLNNPPQKREKKHYQLPTSTTTQKTAPFRKTISKTPHQEKSHQPPQQDQAEQPPQHQNKTNPTHSLRLPSHSQFQGCTHGDHLRPLGWQPNSELEEIPGES